MEEETCKEVCEKPKCNNNSLLSGPLKNNDGFIGIVGLLLVVLAIGIMTAMYLPTKTAKNEYHQAHYAAGITEVVENAENAYLAKNSTFASMDTLAANGYISSNFLSSLSESTTSHGSEFASTWNVGYIGSQALTACITDATPADVSAGWPGCADNPGMSNGYFIGIYSVPTTYANYLAHELPGSGIGSQSAGLDYLAYSAPVPSAPPVNSSPSIPNPAIFRNNGQFTVPSGVNTIFVTAIAGGGSGGGAWGNGGTGGNAGQYIINQPFSITPGEIINITIGQGGPSGWSNAGNNTIIGNLITLSGGSGGCPNCMSPRDGATGASSPFGTGGAPGIYGGWIYGGNAGGNGAGGGGGAASNGSGGSGSSGLVEISYN